VSLKAVIPTTLSNLSENSGGTRAASHSQVFAASANSHFPMESTWKSLLDFMTNLLVVRSMTLSSAVLLAGLSDPKSEN